MTCVGVEVKASLGSDLKRSRLSEYTCVGRNKLQWSVSRCIPSKTEPGGVVRERFAARDGLYCVPRGADHTLATRWKEMLSPEEA